MTEPEKPPMPKPKPKRRWLRRLAIALAVGFLLFLIFYRAILSFVVHTAAIRVAQRENIRLEFKIGGDFLTSLVLHDLHAYPTGPSPVDAIEIEQAEFHYNFWKLATRGLSDFLDSYQLRNASIVVSPVKGTESQKHELADLLRNILAQPALFSDRLEVENFNLTVHTDDGDFLLNDLNASLDPAKTGYIRASEITIPKIATWRDLSAVATYRGRHLIARDFDLGKQIHVTRVELDSSQRAKGVSYLSFEGSVMGGDLGIFLWRRATGSDTDAVQLTASLRNFDMAELRTFLRWKPEVSGKVRQAWIELNGDPDVPSSWNGSSIFKAEAMRFDAVRIDEISGGHQVVNGQALFSGALSIGKNRLDFKSEHHFPDTIDKLYSDDFKAVLDLHAPELPRLSKDLFQGTAKGTGMLQIERGRLALNFQAKAEGVEGRVGGVFATLGSAESYLQAEYELIKRPPGTPWFDGLTAQLDDQITHFRVKDAVVDSSSLSARLEKGTIALYSADFQRGRNSATFGGELRLPEGAITWENLNANLRFDINAPALNEIPATTSPDGLLRGAVTASGKFSRNEGKTLGAAKIEAADLAYKEFSARRLALDLPIENGVAYVKNLELDLNGTDKITGKGSVGLNEPFAYEATLSGKLRDLSVFQPIVKRPIAGSLEIDWRGSGQLRPGRHTGEGRATLHKGRIDHLTGIEAEIAGFYSPEKVDLPTFKVRSDEGAVEAIVSLRDSFLKIAPLRVEVGTKGIIIGSVSIPLDLRTPEKPETILPKDGPIDAQLTLQEVDLDKLLPPPPARPAREKRRKKGEPPAEDRTPSADELGIRGKVNAKLTAAGTLAKPEMALDLQLRGLQLRSAKALQPSAVDASLRFRDDQLVLTGTARIPTASPLSFSGKIPFDLRKVIIEGAIDPDTPIELSATLPPTSANALAQFLPMLRYAEGQVSINASAKGTFRNPILDGGARLSLTALRFQDTNLPGIGNFKADLRLSGNQIIVRQFSGDASGGPFSLAGKVVLEPLGPPMLDLRFRSQGTLLLRNDAVVVRADSDIRIAGPLPSAHVSGKIGINRSRFFREIEILPLGLPGRPSAQPAAPPSSFSIDFPPFRDWSFDVAIKTTEPFVIRSNLASGQAYADLKLGGTGLAPTVEGTARIENFIASLPFSRLEVTTGYLYFTGDPFNPTIDIHGASRIRDYNIHVYIYGTATEPQTVFSSEPTLAQEEIIALLATGATTQEVSDDGSIIAGRAAILLLQDLYQKVFKRQRAPATAATGQREMMDRFHLDVGTVDPRTGRQQVGGRFTLSRQFELAAGVDLEGDVRVELRYLIRFR